MKMCVRLFKVKGIGCANICTLLEHSHKLGKIRKFCKSCLELILAIRFRF